MVDNRRILLMAKLALYDKKYGNKDRKLNEFYQHDYIYKKNFVTRLYALIGGLILLMFYWLYQFFVMGIDLFDMDYQKAIIDSLLFLVALLATYTVIGSRIAIVEYKKAQSRLKKYFILIHRLERLKGKADMETIAEEAAEDEAGIASSRNYY